MTIPLMPKATAVWLIENTTLSFEQIADFCGLHLLEVQGIADGDVSTTISGVNPLTSGQLTKEEVAKCEANPALRLKITAAAEKFIQQAANQKKKGGKYTPVARRQDKPDAISWVLKNCPEMTAAQIVKLIGTTKSTIAAVKERSHWNSTNIRPRDPVLLGLCSQTELDNAMFKARGNREEERDDAIGE